MSIKTGWYTHPCICGHVRQDHVAYGEGATGGPAEPCMLCPCPELIGVAAIECVMPATGVLWLRQWARGFERRAEARR